MTGFGTHVKAAVGGSSGWRRELGSRIVWGASPSGLAPLARVGTGVCSISCSRWLPRSSCTCSRTRCGQ